MRSVALALALAVLAAPAAADETWLLPEDGVYCPAEGQDVYAIVVGPGGGLGIDGLDCENVRLSRGRVRSSACVSNGGHPVDLDTDLLILPSGSMFHDGVLFRRWRGPLPCPVS
ncbi:hypothetical protein ACFQE0_14750 [Methylobacterium komagatae]|uniref:Porin n=1 Tax=Methylobacterium komagatae TaxID=374425 RepID=A0ABW2BLQ2_9HYPH